ncbi:MAG TPA: hypothetical protein VKT82_15425 [Ktedonobacterales bacterium]|nr:hypothetical protein [Ktedonobacterales bacterium]
MTTRALPLPSASTPALTGPRAFVPSLGTYEAVCAAASAKYALQDLADALRAAGVPLHPLVEQHLDAACAAEEEASDAYMAGFPC